ncbi:Protein KTI12 isoform 2 [Schistosoma japonicum]|uniref:Protein KTI12 homolog n=2 Tax=Schistosoma japonicum TaxID=6182 RepID=A0A4Z2DAT6_SCHJA|nr:Protein KTI12 like [Schistosoma japonicum]TNN13595.1 Protein KTI12 isoform 2 [Schistosoma japonicum]
MPLIMLCGYPCSGKSTIASLLADLLKQHFTNYTVLIVNEFKCSNLQSEKIDYDIRCDIYADSQKEREFRGQHKSEVERALTQSQSVIVIMDAPNYIKGYRYELYCLAKSHKHQHIVLLSDIPPEISKHWNSKINRYPDDLLSDMISRFERPQATQRWDNPLVIIEPHLWNSLNVENLESVILQLNQLLSNKSKEKVQPNKSTQPTVISSSNYLQNLEHVTQQVVDHILRCQSNGLSSVGLPMCFQSAQNSDVVIQITNSESKYTAGNLIRLKRRYIGVQRLKFDQFSKPLDNASIAANFIQFISFSGDSYDDDAIN